MLVQKISDVVRRVHETDIRFHAAEIETGSIVASYNPLRMKPYRKRVPDRCGTHDARFPFKRGKVEQVRRVQPATAKLILDLDAQIASLIAKRQYEVELAYSLGVPLTKEEVLRLDTENRVHAGDKKK